MEFIKGIPMQRQRSHTATGGFIFQESGNEAYINPNAIASAVYDPQQDATAIRFIHEDGNAVLKGDVMREYEERVRRHAGDGRDD